MSSIHKYFAIKVFCLFNISRFCLQLFARPSLLVGVGCCRVPLETVITCSSDIDSERSHRSSCHLFRLFCSSHSRAYSKTDATALLLLRRLPQNWHPSVGSASSIWLTQRFRRKYAPIIVYRD